MTETLLHKWQLVGSNHGCDQQATLFQDPERGGAVSPTPGEVCSEADWESPQDKKKNYAGKLLDQSLLRTVWSNQKTH